MPFLAHCPFHIPGPRVRCLLQSHLARTTASHTTRRRSASKGSISNYGAVAVDSHGASASTRPISWHPNSMNLNPAKTWPFPYQPLDAAYSMHFLNDPFTTTQVNGLITPLTQASSGESCYNETFTPLDEMQLQCIDNTYPFPDQTGYNPSWIPQNNPAQHDPARQPSMYSGTHMMHRQMPFTYVSAPDTYTGTAPPTPDFLPTSTYGYGGEEGPQITREPDGEVLVGMGLYDAPSSPNSNALSGGQIALPHRTSAGKGLKLEETFQPSTEEESEDDDGSNDGSNDEVPDSSEATPTARRHRAKYLLIVLPFSMRLAVPIFSAS